jgi:hypothetical protein
LLGGSGSADETTWAGTSAEAGATNRLVTSWVGAEIAAFGLVTSGAGLGISAEVMVNAMGIVHRFRNERSCLRGLVVCSENWYKDCECVSSI